MDPKTYPQFTLIFSKVFFFNWMANKKTSIKGNKEKEWGEMKKKTLIKGQNKKY